jgi:hypothetical protein
MPGRPSYSSISDQRIFTRSEPRWPVFEASVSVHLLQAKQAVNVAEESLALVAHRIANHR